MRALGLDSGELGQGGSPDGGNLCVEQGADLGAGQTGGWSKTSSKGLSVGHLRQAPRKGRSSVLAATPRHDLEAELLVVIDRLHAGKGAGQAGAQAVGLAYQAVHDAELLDVTRQQLGHAVFELG